MSADATVSSFISEVRSRTLLSGDLDIKYGYPPKALLVDRYRPSTLLTDLPVKLEGEQLIISESGSGVPLRGAGSNSRGSGAGSNSAEAGVYKPAIEPVGTKPSIPFSFAGKPGAPTVQPDQNKPLSLTRSLKSKINKDDPPYVPLKDGRGTIVIRVMEDDNSCLFSAISYVATSSVYSVHELRQLVATTVQDNPDLYNEAVLEQKPDEYCQWITMESSWGGGIELGIFAKFFDMEICTIDVSTNEVIRFNEGMSNRAIVVYSGIHYDALVMSPAGSSTLDPSNDLRIFDSSDEVIIAGALELCRELKKRKYFTDTKNFSIKCNICKTGLKGDKAAVEHAKTTGHSDFGEY